MLSVYDEMYQEAVSLVQECKDRKIPLTKLRHSALEVLDDFSLRESHKNAQVPIFSMSTEVIFIKLLFFSRCHLKLFVYFLYKVFSTWDRQGNFAVFEIV